jgi:DNA polymerase-3 subunit delta'
VLFSEIIGQTPLKQRLVRSVKEHRISHAQLFFGPEGAGALPLVLAYAQYISCTGDKDEDACGKCPSCMKYTRLIHPDLHFIYPINSTTSKQDPQCDDFLSEWRSFVLQNPYASLNDWYAFIELENKQGLIKEKESDAIFKKLSFKSFESDFKIAIIWMAEKMNDSASNKLLKLLEEPPEMTVFFLITENAEILLPTVRSRCFPVKVPLINEEDIKNALILKYGIENSQAEIISRLSTGNYQKAIALLNESEETGGFFELFGEFMRRSYLYDMPTLLKLSEQLNALNREKQKAFLEYAMRLIRENAVKHFNIESLNYMTKTEADFSVKFSKFINGKNLVPLSKELNKAYYDIERNGNGRIIFLDLALKIGRLLRTV